MERSSPYYTEIVPYKADSALALNSTSATYTTNGYVPRKADQTPLFKLVKDHYHSFKETYNQHYAQKYGFFRPEIEKELNKFIKCGIFKYGFARIKCKDENHKGCKEEYYRPFSCKSRGLCPSCIQRHALELEILLLDEIIREVPYRHFVYVIPKILRKNFMWHRECLNDLSRIAWSCVKDFMQETLKSEGIPGAIQRIETFGQFPESHNPHCHVIVTDGLFEKNGTFRKMPRYNEGASIYLKSLWEKKVAGYCIEKGFITKEMISKILWWRHTGFSVFYETRIDYKHHDKSSAEKMGHLIRYMAKPPVAMGRITYNGKNVLYRGELKKGFKENLKIYKPNDFLAAVTSHIPKYRQKYINFYGYFSSRTRGYMKEHNDPVETMLPINEPDITPEQRRYKKRWATLIEKVWLENPLKCKKCGSGMKVISVITDAEVKDKLLRHLGVYEDTEIRGPPVQKSVSSTIPKTGNEITSEPYYDDWPGYSEN